VDIPDTAPDRLLVEGIEDYHVVRKLLQAHHVARSFHIENKKGFDNILKSVYTEVNTPRRRYLGILADANNDPSKRWQQLRDALDAAGCRVPSDNPTDGAAFRGPAGQRVGVWLMPDNANPGELEDLVAAMIPPTDPIWRPARDYVERIPVSHRPFQPSKLLRAQVHAWLATRDRPRPMGRAIENNDLRAGVPQATALVEWLTRLFQLQTPTAGHTLRAH